MNYKENYQTLRSTVLEKLSPEPSVLKSGSVRSILITGASGFIGGYLCQRIMTSSEATIYGLVRAKDLEAGRKKLLRQLKRVGGVDDTTRIVPILGDLAQVNLGLPEAQYQELASEIDLIIHSGANVDLVRDYASLMATNVHGSLEVVKFAGVSRIKPIHYISTTTIFDSMGEQAITEMERPDGDGLTMGYSQSKWVSEMLLFEARHRGFPISIYRLGYVSGDSKTGYSNSRGLFHLIWLAMRASGTYISSLLPELNLMPIDKAADCIAALSRSEGHQNRVFHIVHPKNVTQPDHLELIQTHAKRQLGRPLREVPEAQFIQDLNVHYKKTNHPVFFLLYCLLNSGHLKMPNPHITNAATMAAVEELGIHIPVIDQAGFDRELNQAAQYYRI